jgi:hypothetical protein
MQAVDRALLFALAFLAMFAVTPIWASTPERAAEATIVAIVQATPATATNVINTDHTVTGTATDSISGTPLVGYDMTFEVLTGPNAGATGAGTTDVNGQATFTYTGSGGAGDDSIEVCVFFAPPARTGRPQLGLLPLDCDTVTKTWIVATPTATATASPTTAPTSTAIAATTTPTPTAVPSPTTTPAQLPGTGSGDGGSSLPWVVLGIAAFAALALLAGTAALKRVR